MNCRRIEKLMPLFVEGDLDVRDTNAVSLHLNDCRDCSQMMSEYGESQNWLRTFVPPEFDGAFFVDLKHSVMQEIERKPMRPTWLQRLIERWLWKPSWAMAMVMLVLAGALMFYIYSGKPKSDSTNPVISRDEKDQQQEPKENQPQPKLDEPKKPYDFSLVTHQPRRWQPKAAKKSDEPLLVAMPQKMEPLENFAINIFDNTLENNPIDMGSIADLVIFSESTRMEFQTGDPNIRIIWFAPKLNISQSSKIDTE